VYDLAGRLVSVTQAFGTSHATTTTYAYDDAGHKTSETDALGHSTSYTYDAAGNLTATTGVKGSFTYGYDNARNQVSITDANSNTTHMTYDARKRAGGPFIDLTPSVPHQSSCAPFIAVVSR
jgi:YD repeat-containing protein